MTTFMEDQIKRLPTDGMLLLYEDVIHRIGSHGLGGNPDPNYVKKQKQILNLIQDELERRKNKAETEESK